jgi:hypothetical protein
MLTPKSDSLTTLIHKSKLINPKVTQLSAGGNLLQGGSGLFTRTVFVPSQGQKDQMAAWRRQGINVPTNPNAQYLLFYGQPASISG